MNTTRSLEHDGQEGLAPVRPLVVEWGAHGSLSQVNPESPGPRKRNWIFAAVLLVAIAAGLALGVIPRWQQRQQASSDMSLLTVPSVAVVSPTIQSGADGLTLPAEIRPWREASIYARANGYLQDWVADIGAHVESGQLLAMIETPDLDQQLEQAKAQLALAQANLNLAKITDERWQTLLKTASVSEQEAAEKAAARETAAASVEADRANMRRLQELVSFQRVVAPFAGTITSRTTDIGDLIVAGSGGQQLFHIAQADKLRVYVHVPETWAPGITVGQKATLTTPENVGQKFVATVTTTAKAISLTSRTLLTELEVDNAKNEVLPYSYGEVHLDPTHSAPMTVLPANTLIFRAEGLQVAVVRPDNTIELRSIQVGRDFGDTIEILGGVKNGERVVANPTDSLVAGTKVSVKAS